MDEEMSPILGSSGALSPLFLFGLLRALALAQAHTGTASVLVDEFDAGVF